MVELRFGPRLILYTFKLTYHIILDHVTIQSQILSWLLTTQGLHSPLHARPAGVP